MTLTVRFAKFCRWLLTPYRKKIILKRIKSRIKDSQLNYRLNTHGTSFLSFKYIAVNKKRPFGIILILNSDISIYGCVLRCGCVHLDYGMQCVKKAYILHKNIVNHGNLLDEVNHTIDTEDILHIKSNNVVAGGNVRINYNLTSGVVLPKFTNNPLLNKRRTNSKGPR